MPNPEVYAAPLVPVVDRAELRVPVEAPEVVEQRQARVKYRLGVMNCALEDIGYGYVQPSNTPRLELSEDASRLFSEEPSAIVDSNAWKGWLVKSTGFIGDPLMDGCDSVEEFANAKYGELEQDPGRLWEVRLMALDTQHSIYGDHIRNEVDQYGFSSGLRQQKEVLLGRMISGGVSEVPPGVFEQLDRLEILADIACQSRTQDEWGGNE